MDPKDTVRIHTSIILSVKVDVKVESISEQHDQAKMLPSGTIDGKHSKDDEDEKLDDRYGAKPKKKKDKKRKEKKKKHDRESKSDHRDNPSYESSTSKVKRRRKSTDEDSPINMPSHVKSAESSPSTSRRSSLDDNEHRSSCDVKQESCRETMSTKVTDVRKVVHVCTAEDFSSANPASCTYSEIATLKDTVKIESDFPSLEAENETEHVSIQGVEEQSLPGIKQFSDQSDSLSNYFSCDVHVYGQIFTSSEQAYQWRKAIFMDHPKAASAILHARNPGQAKRVARKCFEENSEDGISWEFQKIPVMRQILRAKARSCSEFVDNLRWTENMYIVEVGKQGKDPFWGVSKDGDGENALGRLLMELRGSLDEALSEDAERDGKANNFMPDKELPVDHPSRSDILKLNLCATQNDTMHKGYMYACETPKVQSHHRPTGNESAYLTPDNQARHRSRDRESAYTTPETQAWRKPCANIS